MIIQSDVVEPSSTGVEQVAERLECVVCCEEINPAKTLRLPCKHCYHASCMNDWAQQHTGCDVTCPQCRAPVSQDILQELQRPLNYADMLVLPIVFLALMIESLYGYMKTAIRTVKDKAVKLRCVLISRFVDVSQLLQLFVTTIGTQLVEIGRWALSVGGMAGSYLQFTLQTFWQSSMNVFSSCCYAAITLAEPVKMLIRWGLKLGDAAFVAMSETAGFLLQRIRHIMAPLCAFLRNKLCFAMECALHRMQITFQVCVCTIKVLLQRATVIKVYLCTQVVASLLWTLQKTKDLWQRIQFNMALIIICIRVVFYIVGRAVSEVSWRMFQACVQGMKIVAHYVHTFLVWSMLLAASAMLTTCELLVRVWDGLHTVTQRVSEPLRWIFRAFCHGAKVVARHVSTFIEWIYNHAGAAVVGMLRMVADLWQKVRCVLVASFACALDNFCVAIQRMSRFSSFLLQILEHLAGVATKGLEMLRIWVYRHATASVHATLQTALKFWQCIRPVVVPAFAWVWNGLHIIKQKVSCVLATLKWLSLLMYEQVWAMAVAMFETIASVLQSIIIAVCANASDMFDSIVHATSHILGWGFHLTWRALCCVAHGILEILVTIWITAQNIVYHPRCRVCEKGCAKLRSLCFTCVVDHLVPRCSDCGVGWCKVQTRCFSCSVDYYFENPRCDVCKRGFKKVNKHCVTCFTDQFFSRCAVCQRGYQKLGGSYCFSCYADRFLHRCGVCGQGYCKIGTCCFRCFYSNPPRCTVCCRGFQKIGPFCFTCYLDRFYSRCAVCQQGCKKIGSLCLTCHLDRFYTRCGVCNRGYAKIGPRCLTCFRHYMTNYPRCGVCCRGYAKIGTRCITCFKTYIRELLRNPPRCGICQRGYAKIGLRCLTCYRTLASQSGHRVVCNKTPQQNPHLPQQSTNITQLLGDDKVGVQK